jgi:hypothetical protein
MPGLDLPADLQDQGCQGREPRGAVQRRRTRTNYRRSVGVFKPNVAFIQLQ